MLRLVLACLVAISIAGCSGTPRDTFQLDDHDKVANAFLETVREYYATRSDGKLSEPTINGTRVHFVYRYNLINGGKFAEQVDCNLHKASYTRDNSGEPHNGPPTWDIAAHFNQDGPDPEATAVYDAVLAGMKAKLGEVKRLP